MQDDGGVLGGLFGIVMIFALLSKCESDAKIKAERLAAMPPPEPGFPYLGVFLLVVALVLIIGCFVLAHAYYSAHLAKRRKQTAKQHKLQREQEYQQRIITEERKVFAHWEQIRTEDAEAQQAFLIHIRKSYRRSISLRANPDDQNHYATFHWKGVPETDGTVCLYRGGETLHQNIHTIEEQLGEKGLIATRSLKRSGRYQDPRTGLSATYFIYWRASYVGTKPALILNGKTVETYKREDLLKGYELTTLPYRKTFKGGLRAERLRIPSIMQPLDREEADLNDLERAQYLQARREKLTGKTKTDEITTAANAAVEQALEETKKKEELVTAMDGIRARDDIDEEAKDQAIAELQSRFGLNDLFSDETEHDYEI